MKYTGCFNKAYSSKETATQFQSRSYTIEDMIILFSNTCISTASALTNVNVFAAINCNADQLSSKMDSIVEVRMDIFTILCTYLSPTYPGYRIRESVAFWRIRSGINQEEVLCTENDQTLASATYSKSTSVDFETVWGQGHTEAERFGSIIPNFIFWVQ